MTVPGEWLDAPVVVPANPQARKIKTTKIDNRVEKVRRIYARDGRRCWWCGRVLMPLDEVPEVGRAVGSGERRMPPNFPTIDHLTPRSLGGTNGLDNLVVACFNCNHERGDAMPRQTPIPGRTVVHSVGCPDCVGGMTTEGHTCLVCDGSGDLSTERAVALYAAARQTIRRLERSRQHVRTERNALKRMVEEELGPDGARRDLSHVVGEQRDTIRTLADRVLVLKAEVALRGGAPVEQTVPNPEMRARAIRLHAEGVPE